MLDLPLNLPLSGVLLATLCLALHLSALPKNRANVDETIDFIGRNAYLAGLEEGGKWCQRRELNPRPRAYESPALPLSYSGTLELGRFFNRGAR